MSGENRWNQTWDEMNYRDKIDFMVGIFTDEENDPP